MSDGNTGFSEVDRGRDSSPTPVVNYGWRHTAMELSGMAEDFDVLARRFSTVQRPEDFDIETADICSELAIEAKRLSNLSRELPDKSEAAVCGIADHIRKRYLELKRTLELLDGPGDDGW